MECYVTNPIMKSYNQKKTIKEANIANNTVGLYFIFL